ERVDLRPLQDSVGDSGELVSSHLETQRRIASGEEIVTVVLPRVGVRIGELDVGEETMGSRLVDPGRIEDLSVRLVFVESPIQKFPLIHSGGRAAEGEGTGDAHRLVAQSQRVRDAEVV